MNIKQLIQVGTIQSLKLCKIKSLVINNKYSACELDNNSDQLAETENTFEVYNLAESPVQSGQLSTPTNALTMEIHGKYYVYISEGGSSVTLGKIVSSAGGAKYNIQPVTMRDTGQTDPASSTQISAFNLAEMTVGPGGAVDNNTLVILHQIAASNSDDPINIFSHTTYAKYLD